MEQKRIKMLWIGMGIVIVMITLLFMVMFIRAKRKEELESKYKIVYSEYQIQYGDTAYGLASKNKYPGMDSRDYIRELGETNCGINLFKEPLRCGAYLMLITYVPK